MTTTRKPPKAAKHRSRAKRKTFPPPEPPRFRGRLIQYINDGDFRDSIEGFFFPTIGGAGGASSARARFFGEYDGWWVLVYSSVSAAIVSLGSDGSQEHFALTEILNGPEFIAGARMDGCRIALDSHRGTDDNMHFREVTDAGLRALH